MNKQEFLDKVIKARMIKKGCLTKKELNDVYDGIKAMENLGAFDKENWQGEKKPMSIGSILKGGEKC